MTKTCPHCGGALEETTAGRNTGEAAQIAVPAALLPALEHALAIGRNTAMMSSEPEVMDGLEALRKMVETMVPAEARHFREGQWAALVSRMAAGVDLSIEAINAGTPWSPSHVVAIADLAEMAWPKGEFENRSIMHSSPLETEVEAQALRAALGDMQERLAPMVT